MNGRLVKFAIFAGGGLIVIFILVIIFAMIRCVYTNNNCPTPGALREVFEDLVALVIGFVGGRATK